MADDDKAHRDRLRRENTRRLRVLELRKARQGDATDPAVLTEMEEIRANLAFLDLADAPKPAPEVRASVGSESILDLVIAQVGKFGERLTGVEERIVKVETRQEDAAEWRFVEREERQYGQRRNFRISMANLILLLLIIAAALLFLTARAGA